MAMTPIGTIFRFALLAAWDNKCAICGELLRQRDMEVDHIIPQHLESDAAALQRELARFGLSSSFDIFSYANQVPAHRACNRAKSGVLQTEQFGRWMLERAAVKVAAVQEQQRKLERELESERARMVLVGALERGALDRNALLAVLAAPPDGPEPGSWKNPLVGIFSVAIEDLRSEVEAAPTEADMIATYNELEVNLCEYLEKAPIAHMMYTEETARNGTTLYARVACWETTEEAIRSALSDSWWHIVGVHSFFEVYGRYFGEDTSTDGVSSE